MNKTLAICLVGVYTLIGLYLIPSEPINETTDDISMCVSANDISKLK